MQPRIFLLALLIFTRCFAWLAPGVLILHTAGCRTTPRLPAVDTSTPGWAVKTGQAVWQPRREAPELAGDIQYAVSQSGDIFLQFTKTPLPLVAVQTSGDDWEIHFIPQKRVLAGKGEPTSRVAWLQLARCLQGREPSAGWEFSKTGANSWRIENAKTGESVEGFLD